MKKKSQTKKSENLSKAEADKLIILKVDSMQQREKLETFVFSEIYPHYNDQHNLFTSN